MIVTRWWKWDSSLSGRESADTESSFYRFARGFGHWECVRGFVRNEIRFQGIVTSLLVKGKIKSAADLFPTSMLFNSTSKERGRQGSDWIGQLLLYKDCLIVSNWFLRDFSGICRKMHRLLANKIKFFYNLIFQVKIRMELFEWNL